MRTSRWPILVALGLLLVALCPAPAGATCVARTPEQVFAAATVVFRGRATGIDPPHPDRNTVYFAPARVTFAVDTTWKGPVAAEMVVVVNPTGSASQHVDVWEGEEYLVHAEGRGPDALYTDSCIGFIPARSLVAPPPHLGPGAPPDEQPLPALPRVGAGGAGRRHAALAAGTLAGGLIALAALGRRRRGGQGAAG